jgi:predicted Zn-dependent protease
LGGAYIDQGQSAAAEKVLLAGIQKRPSISTVHRMLGDVYAKRGDVLHAAQEYQISLQREPLHLYAYINYGKLCLQTGAYDQAVQLWKTSVAINPEFILGYYYLANYYIHTKGDPDSAMFFIREIQDHGSVVMPDLLEAVEALKTHRE